MEELGEMEEDIELDGEMEADGLIDRLLDELGLTD